MKLRWTDSGVVLDDPQDFESFKVQVDRIDAPPEQLAAAFSGIAVFSDPHTAWVFEAALRQWKGCEKDAAWQAGLDRMIAKARPHGWIDDARGAIRSHVEWLQRGEQ
jgi:hypothetical protein